MLVVLVALAACAIARADEVTIRMAAIAPEGSAWAREMHAFSRDVAAQTRDAVRIKWYLGGIAGDELAALDRVHRNQLDGLAGAIFCLQLAPSLWVTRIVGLFRDRNEGQEIINRLRPTIKREMEQHGFVHLGDGTFGAEVLFSREPVRSMADLRKMRLWLWDLDDFLAKELPSMGVRSVALPIQDAAAAYEGNEVDGFISVPTAALAYRWSAQAKYFSELPPTILPACVAISQRAFDLLTFEQQTIVRSAAAKFSMRFGDLGEQQDRALLGDLFERQGLKRVPVSPDFLAEFRRSADRTREQLAASLLSTKHVAPSVMTDVMGWLAELRARAPKH